MNKATPCKIGDILVQQGSLNPEQLHTLLELQRTDGRPLGVLAEQRCGVSPAAIEAAWLEQYLGYDVEVDLDRQRIDDELIGLIDRRQAWQFQMLPLRRVEFALLVVTTKDMLTRSAAFAWRQFHEPVITLVADPRQVEAKLKQRYPWPAAEAVRRRRWPLTRPVQVSAHVPSVTIRPAAVPNVMPCRPTPG